MDDGQQKIINLPAEPTVDLPWGISLPADIFPPWAWGVLIVAVVLLGGAVVVMKAIRMWRGR